MKLQKEKKIVDLKLMSWIDIIKNPNKMVCPICDKRTFGIDINAKGREKYILRCSDAECGYKQSGRR